MSKKKSMASRAGVRVGDVITKVGDHAVTDATDITQTLSQSVYSPSMNDVTKTPSATARPLHSVAATR
jgi:S1-C subfamily serine protease